MSPAGAIIGLRQKKQQQRRVGTVLGTMSIPHQLDLQATVQALEVFRATGHAEVDTAIMYEGGETEKTLGEEKRGALGGGARKTNIRHPTM